MQPDGRDAALLSDMLQFAGEVQVLVARIAPHDYLQDLATRRAIERCVELIGEAADHVSEGFRDAHPEIPWREIIAQRHRLIHGYRDVDPERIRNVVDRRYPLSSSRCARFFHPFHPIPSRNREHLRRGGAAWLQPAGFSREWV